MSDEQNGQDPKNEAEADTDGQGQDSQEESGDRSTREQIEDRFKQGLGVLGAFRDAIEDTIREAKERGDLSPEKAKEAMRSALDKAQEKAGEARDAIDFVKQKEFDGLKNMVEDLKDRMGRVEQKMGSDDAEGGDGS